MIEALIIVALVLYGVRYAYSGVDNALYYGRGDDPQLPDIHDAEAAQSWASHGSTFLLIVAIVLLKDGWSWQHLGGLAASMFGASLVADAYFNRFIYLATGTDTRSWYWPLFGINVPKVFSGRRGLQRIVGVVIFLIGLAFWVQ